MRCVACDRLFGGRRWFRDKCELPTELTVTGDAAALRRAVKSLVGNALIHGPADRKAHVAVSVTHGRAEIALRDDGDGIPHAAQETAFDRFWRGRGSADRSGSGLGLAVVRAAAACHGGMARAYGSTVTLSLPLDAQPRPHQKTLA